MTYTIYGGELSYFTRKLEAAMIFYGADFEMKRKDANNSQEIEHRSGTHQVPILLTPENWMIGDTTPLLQMLDGRFAGRELFPDGPLGILTQIVEDYFDEWVARTMVHYRWHYEESAIFASEKMSGGDAEAAARIRNWGPRACRATGTDSLNQQERAEAEYLRIMDAMESQLQASRYLLGDRPAAVDCVVLGSLRAHTNMDPTPKRAIAKCTRVLEWVDKTADDWDGCGELSPFADPTPFVQFVLNEMQSTYAPYILGNSNAHGVGAKAFHVDIYGEEVSYLCRPYPEKSRLMIVDKIAQLQETKDKVVVSEWLNKVKLEKCFG